MREIQAKTIEEQKELLKEGVKVIFDSYHVDVKGTAIIEECIDEDQDDMEFLVFKINVLTCDKKENLYLMTNDDGDIIVNDFEIKEIL